MRKKENSLSNQVAFYNSRLTDIDREIQIAVQQGNRFSKLRGFAFFSSLVLGVWGWTGDYLNAVAYGIAAVAFAVFIWLIVKHEQNLATVNVGKLKHKINQLQLYRIARKWKRIPDRPITVEHKFKTLSDDLGLFGHASMYSLMSRAQTPFGIETLKNWILHSATPDEIAARQDAVQHLSAYPEFLERLDLEGRLLASSQAGPSEFVSWAESKPWLQNNRSLIWFIRILTVTILASIIASLFGILSVQPSMITIFSLIVVSIFANVIFMGKIHDIFNRVDSRSNDISHYGNLFSLIEQLPVDCHWLAKLKSEMRTTAEEPKRLLHRLSRIMRFANLRRSPIFGILHVPIQLISFWDFHVLVFLESWQQKYGKKVRPWFQAIGKLESIASLAAIAHDHPDWCYPSFLKEGEPREIVAESIGHPYLADRSCVRNDVRVGPCGTLLLVTGSNMSGKSTLLRAIGTNATLAQMGAPVCATKMTLPPVRIATSMRVQDSLEDGVSFFMAELKQLKKIVDLSSEIERPKFTLLFLLDEILQGTNSVERHIAVARVVHQLVSNNAIGTVSTHDLELANHPDLKDLCENVHFRETIMDEEDEGTMTFDYQMHQGLATTTNALKLLRLVGLAENINS